MRLLEASDLNLAVAAQALSEGQIIVMPTETVYGLAADALNPDAVDKLFAAKGRPSDNPLIVHVESVEQALRLTTEFPTSAEILAERFWPGPLTLVLAKSDVVGMKVTGGLNTVAVRMPKHPVALGLIKLAGPVAAPSANRFMMLSPTKVEHLDPALLEHVAYVIDGGPTEVGVESTVVDCSGAVPRILRPGGVSRGSIEAALGSPLGSTPPMTERRSPGMYQRHYAPRARVRLVDELSREMAGLTFSSPLNDDQIQMPLDASFYSAALYDRLHRLDARGFDEICVQTPPDGPDWEAVRDRLSKASAG